MMTAKFEVAPGPVAVHSRIGTFDAPIVERGPAPAPARSPELVQWVHALTVAGPSDIDRTVRRIG